MPSNPCLLYGCIKCCLQTEMLLSLKDVLRIEEKGYDRSEFCFRNELGLNQLRNIEGRCFFLKNNRCSVYHVRPDGCQFYPLIYTIDTLKNRRDDYITIDPFCPHGNEFKEIETENNRKLLTEFIESLLREI